MKQLDMKEMVAWNETLQETRREELERQHGVKHWMDQKNSKTIELVDHALSTFTDRPWIVKCERNLVFHHGARSAGERSD